MCGVVCVFDLLFNVVYLLKPECVSCVIYQVLMYGVCLCALRACMCGLFNRGCVIRLRFIVW